MTAKTSFRGSFTALVTPFRNAALDEKSSSAACKVIVKYHR